MRSCSYTGSSSKRPRSPDGSGVNREVHASFCERLGVKSSGLLTRKGSTKMARFYGRSPYGQRCVAALPHGHWKTTALVGALRATGMTAPMVLDSPMDPRARVAWKDDKTLLDRLIGARPTTTISASCLLRMIALQAALASSAQPRPTPTMRALPCPREGRLADLQSNGDTSYDDDYAGNRTLSRTAVSVWCPPPSPPPDAEVAGAEHQSTLPRIVLPDPTGRVGPPTVPAHRTLLSTVRT
ncbi:hypothetical protein CI41S_66460 [Bradyrhizobium ivorense]|nr:hypothetical protein CI41S_66460 [Bradyrhizobium ivorense]